MLKQYKVYYQSPIGILQIKSTEKGIESILFTEKETIDANNSTSCKNIHKCITQLDEYFSQNRTVFKLVFDLKGTAFQQRVWNELLNVPFGKTKSYLEQAKALGDVKAIRAVASANGRNPISIIIPCHRIIGSDGSLTGYAGGIWRKKWLLTHESGYKQQTLF